ncbi:hypothetical protein BCV71DRAFT_123176 [Rhizopus microsporus]|uniref:Uncharacterized protein n=1 Tax=Rhizopus microsporus TaxID=58291 RepID=A0A1X0S0Y9_RHIZD|nr:hypothetical protein BCV71DRAFT_123176 [Rhizopus microsporus]
MVLGQITNFVMSSCKVTPHVVSQGSARSINLLVHILLKGKPEMIHKISAMLTLYRMDVVKKFESYGSQSGRPTKKITIADCGEL